MPFDGFPPLISSQLQYLFNHSPHTIQIEQAWSGTRYFPGSLDRFTLLIPYCLGYIKWDIIYNAEFPLAAPDVIFGPEDDGFHPFLAVVREEGDSRLVKNSLTDWNNKDPTRLLALVMELRDKYRSYQERRVGEVDDDRLKFEISTIVSREGIEMHMSSGVEKPGEVKFAVPLMDMNINKMVLACPWSHPQKIYLQVIYPVGRKYASATSVPRLKLMCTPELKTLFSIDEVKLPAWLDGMCMAEYLPQLEELLQRQVIEAVTSIDVRRKFIEALSPVLGRPLEADPVFCRRASFLVYSGPFTFLVHFFLSTHFPKQRPSLMFQSIQVMFFLYSNHTFIHESVARKILRHASGPNSFLMGHCQEYQHHYGWSQDQAPPDTFMYYILDILFLTCNMFLVFLLIEFLFKECWFWNLKSIAAVPCIVVCSIWLENLAVLIYGTHLFPIIDRATGLHASPLPDWLVICI